MQAVIEFFKKSKVFYDLSDKELAQLSGKTLLQQYPINTLLARQGEDSNQICFVLSGNVRVSPCATKLELLNVLSED